MNDEQRAALVDIIGRAILAGDMDKGPTRFVVAIETAIGEIDRILDPAQNQELQIMLANAYNTGYRNASKESDIDAMLNAVHPLTAVITHGFNRDHDHIVCIGWPDERGHRSEDTEMAALGATFTEAIADACQKAREAQS